MTTRQQVLELLRKNGNGFISGQDIANRLYVSRAAVWKAIKALEKEGYCIDAVTNKGYRLKNEAERMSAESVRYNLVEAGISEIDVYYSDSIDSTNEWAKRYSDSNYGKEALFIAGSQSSGKGRSGRDFYSPEGTGIYMSLLLYPGSTPQEATHYTCMMADCVCEGIKAITGIDTEIKWVNDIYYKDRKIAGILTEGMTSMEDGKLTYMIIGVGVNIYMPFEGFPDSIAKTAGYLFESTSNEDVRSKICAAITAHFMNYYNNPKDTSYIESYRQKSMLIGKYVKLLTPGHDERKVSKGYAKVVGIDDNCHLNIVYDDGTPETLSCGEVSVVKY